MSYNPYEEYEPPVCFNCDRCGNAIYDGDTFFQIDNISYGKTLIICEECISECKNYAEYEPYEPDGCDLYKARVERDMCCDN